MNGTQQESVMIVNVFSLGNLQQPEGSLEYKGCEKMVGLFTTVCIHTHCPNVSTLGQWQALPTIIWSIGSHCHLATMPYIWIKRNNE
jgi:hypothetical protein